MSPEQARGLSDTNSKIIHEDNFEGDESPNKEKLLGLNQVLINESYFR